MSDVYKDAVERVYGSERVRWGILFRGGSCWVGVHWSRDNRRFCINLIPFVTMDYA